jgi:hypothetical protein
MDLIENDASNNSSLVTCNRCCGKVYTEPLRGLQMQIEKLMEEIYSAGSLDGPVYLDLQQTFHILV